MSVTLFCQVAFAWMASQRIDFRKSRDPYCGDCPTALVCDGTHQGPCHRLCEIAAVPDICKATDDSIRKLSHQKFTRTLLVGYAGSNTITRKYFKALMNLISERNNGTTFELDNGKFKDLTDALCLPVRALLKLLVDDQFENVELTKAVTRLFTLLSSEAALVAIFPFHQLDKLEDIISTIADHGSMSTKEFLVLTDISGIELKETFLAARNSNHLPLLCQAVIAMIGQVRNVHGLDEELTMEEQPNSYEPNIGTAYYFTASGNVLRKLPSYEANSKNQTGTDGEKCGKKFPKVTKGGYSQVFVWMCGQHGYSYGFHIIPNHEGPKDAFSSMLKYKKDPPKAIIYDFACALSAYCLSREPHFYRQTQFFHDIFHQYNHKCGTAFRLSRFPNVQVNSEIAEQFNSYIKRFKYTATHLSVDKYSFLMQYAIHKWNVRITKKLSARVKLAKKCMI